jgi:hypothetical protein
MCVRVPTPYISHCNNNHLHHGEINKTNARENDELEVSEIHEMLLCVFYLIINKENIKCKTTVNRSSNINFMGISLTYIHSHTHIHIRPSRTCDESARHCVYLICIIEQWKLRIIPRRMRAKVFREREREKLENKIINFPHKITIDVAVL